MAASTWTEPSPRLRNAALEQIEFWDAQKGWISGESIDPLARNPFLMLTTDGGHTWRQKLLLDDEKYGTIAQFHFDSQNQRGTGGGCAGRAGPYARSSTPA